MSLTKKLSISQLLRSRGWSDTLYWLNFKFAWGFLIFCFILNALSGLLCISDLAIINVGIPAVFAELGIHTGFIVDKARRENESKYGYKETAG